jgi:TPP-dependent pyruvate/acetoin dehydrogenase alpha subunit
MSPKRSGPSSSATSALRRPLLERAYYLLKLTRAVEDRAALLYRQGKIHGGNFSSRGQEAISVGSALALEPQDKVAPMIRNLGVVLTRGWSPKDVLSSYLARAQGPNRGKDNSTHFGDIEETGVIACISMLGTLVPVMAGMALAGKLRKRRLVTMTYVGDGATSTGEFHEGLNFAAVYQVPFVLIIENNHWAYSTPVERQTRVKDLAVKAAAYGIPYAIGDGNDVAEVYSMTREFVEEARAGGGPRVIEFKTMRMRGHAQHDDAGYVPKPTFEEWEKRDPIDRCEKLLGLSSKEKAEIEARIEKEVSEAEQYALAGEYPPGEEAVKGVFADDSITAHHKWWNEPG